MKNAVSVTFAGCSPGVRVTDLYDTGARMMVWGALAGVVLIASTAFAAGEPAPAAIPVVQTAAPSQETFRARVRGELADWRDKMRGLDKDAEASGRRTADAAETRLRSAWSRTEVAGQRVESASARDWDSVKASYEAASHEMAVAWKKDRP